jgi:hypothetical protein
MNARRPEPRPRPTYTYWPAARPPSRDVASPLLGPANHLRQGDGGPPELDAKAEAGHYRNTEAAPLQEEDPAAPGLDEPGYGHGV